MKGMALSIIITLGLGQTLLARELNMTMSEAENLGVASSNMLRAYNAEREASEHLKEAQFQSLLPKLALTGNYLYNYHIPDISLGPSKIPFGTHDTFSIGPNLTYTLWDGFSSRDNYKASSLLAASKKEDQSNSERQLLYSIRSAYIQVQLGLEELKMINASLTLAKAQNHDVNIRHRAGSASRLDVVNSERSVLSYEIQFKQRQAELSLALKELMNLIGNHDEIDLSHPGPANIPNVTYVVMLEPLSTLLSREKENNRFNVDANHPKIRSQELQAQSYDFSAKGQSSKEGPTVQVSAGLNYMKPSMPNPPKYWQESVGINVSLPLFIGDATRDLAAQARSQAEAARFRANQLRADLEKDFAKSQELLSALYEQQKLAYQDVNQSEESAKLNYISYKSGKINFVDVQNANNQALLSKVAATRIDAQILNQIALLKSFSGETNVSR